MQEFTNNGIMYTWGLAGPNGADYILFPEEHHTKSEIKDAKQFLRDTQDVVSVRVASNEDRDYLYKTEIFRVPQTQGLQWYEINQDENLIRKSRKAGLSPLEFVEVHVLPFVEETKLANEMKYGASMYAR